MIIHTKGAKEQSSLADLLGGGEKGSSAKANGMFARLLATLGTTAKGENAAGEIPANGTFKTVVDPKNSKNSAVTAMETTAKHPVTSSNTTEKTEKTAETGSAGIGELQVLPKGSEEGDEGAVSGELLRTLSGDQVRTLIHRAKEYLRNEIAAKAPEYHNDSKTLPKSLMGLVHLADKLGLEPQSITLSTLVSDTAESDGFPAELLSQPLLNPKTLPHASAPLAPRETAGTITQLLLDPKTLPQPAAASEENTSTLTQLLGEVRTKAQRASAASERTGDREQSAAPVEEHPARPLLKRDMPAKEEDGEQNVTKGGEHPAKTTPPVSVQTASADNAEPIPISPQGPKAEEKPSSPSQTSQTQGLIALLQGESEPSETTSEANHAKTTETEGGKTFAAPKAESLEVKTKEAQQSMRHFATELKEAVENYKPPFTRLSMKLNPEKLGEVEVTLIQRGANVHVNIQSNNAASVAFLAHNATELKAQLAHQGITNATMNFMGGGENQNAHQHHQEHSRNPFRSYPSFEELELNEEQLGALEIIIPHYA